MIDPSVSNFFAKNAGQGYLDQYDKDHGPRLDAMIKQWNLKETLKDKKIIDVGGGLGFLGKRLDPSTEYWIWDGADIEESQLLCKVKGRILGDLNVAEVTMENDSAQFNTAFCLETLEHLTNPYNCLAQIKKLVKIGGDVIISIPHFNVTHNYIYPALMADPQNFVQFLNQMALPVKEYWLWSEGWNAHHFKCENRPYSEKKMLFEKHESKFINATPVEMVNW